MFKDIRAGKSRRKEIMTRSQSRNRMMRIYRRISDTTAYVEHETPGKTVINLLEKNRCAPKKHLPVICPVNDCFMEALDYLTYHLADRLSRYNDEVA